MLVQTCVKYAYESKSSGGVYPDHLLLGRRRPLISRRRGNPEGLRELAWKSCEARGLSISLITNRTRLCVDIDLCRNPERRDILLNLHHDAAAALASCWSRERHAGIYGWAALKHLREAGLAVGVSACPLNTGITDRKGAGGIGRGGRRRRARSGFFLACCSLMPSSAQGVFGLGWASRNSHWPS